MTNVIPFERKRVEYDLPSMNINQREECLTRYNALPCSLLG